MPKSPFNKKSGKDEARAKAERFLEGIRVPYDKQPDGTILAKGHIYIHSLDTAELPDLSMVVVQGDFHCSDLQITSLKGAPREVTGSFICSYNQLTSLEGAPQKVGKHFGCSKNQLTSLKGAPREIAHDFMCDNNQLTSLEGASEKVGGMFICSSNQLTILLDAPQSVGGAFIALKNKLEELEGVGRFSILHTDLGVFRSWEEIPPHLRVLEENIPKLRKDIPAPKRITVRKKF